MVAGTFGGRVKELRKSKNWTQKKLAATIGIDSGYLSKIESAKVAPPSEKVIRRIAKAFCASQDELMVLAGRMPSDPTDPLPQSAEVTRIFRRARGLTPQDWRKVDQFIQELKMAKEDAERE